MTIVIIDYDLGNLGSVKNALDKWGIDSVISNSIKQIKAGSGLILPGVGSANQGMENLKRAKLDKVIIDQIKMDKPFLGICLGMQLLFSKSEEGNVKCLNIIKGTVKKFNSKLKIPQIGWNTVKKTKESMLLQNIPRNSYFYFVHSFICIPKQKEVITGETEYGQLFCSVFEKDNIFGTQFHPERSGAIGLRLLQNFINITKSCL